LRSHRDRWWLYKIVGFSAGLYVLKIRYQDD
jgi:hypothetical protein